MSFFQIEKITKKAKLGKCNITPVGAGHYNNSYYLDSDGGRFVLRIAPADSVPKLFYEIDMMKSEPAIHKLVKEKTTLPIPEIIFYDFSREIIESDYLIMDFIEGDFGYFDEAELGSLVKRLHEIKSDYCGYPDRKAPTAKSWPKIFSAYVKLIFDDCLSCKIIDNDEYEWFLSVYNKNSEVVVDVEPCFCHLDLWSQNILINNGRITGILDFDRGLFGDPELEFAVLDTYGYATEAFFKGYGKSRPNDKNARIRQRLYIVYELIKYAFIRYARGGNYSLGRSFVSQCKTILKEIK